MRKFAVLSSEGIMRRHCAVQGGTVNPCDAVCLKSKKCRSVAWQITTHPGTWPNLSSQFWLNAVINRCFIHKSPLTLLHASFPVFCLKNTPRGKWFEDVRRIEYKVTQQLLQMHRADNRRYLEQRKCLWNNLIQVEVFWFRRDQYVLKVTSVLLVRQRQSGFFLIRPGGGTSE